MSPELETLDQLIGGDLPLIVIRSLFDDTERFARSLTAMLATGEVRLLAGDGTDVPDWQWPEVLAIASRQEAPVGFRIAITLVGARRIK